MNLLKAEVKRSYDDLLKRLKVNRHSIVLLNIGNEVKKSDIQDILDYFIDILKDGTLCLVGDCEFNTVTSNLDAFSKLTEIKRKEIFLPIPFKLLALKENVRYANHPSLEIACYGRHAKYLTRHQSLDFPFGDTSIFSDFYELDAVYLTIGKDERPYSLKYAGNLNDKIISRNLCLYEDKEYSYLDFEFDIHEAAKQFKGLSLYELSNPIIYGERYRYLIDEIRKSKQ